MHASKKDKGLFWKSVLLESIVGEGTVRQEAELVDRGQIMKSPTKFRFSPLNP